MATGVYKMTEEFEKALSDYTGAPYVVTLDNQSNGLLTFKTQKQLII